MSRDRSVFELDLYFIEVNKGIKTNTHYAIGRDGYIDVYSDPREFKVGFDTESDQHTAGWAVSPKGGLEGNTSYKDKSGIDYGFNSNERVINSSYTFSQSYEKNGVEINQYTTVKINKWKIALMLEPVPKAVEFLKWLRYAPEGDIPILN